MFKTILRLRISEFYFSKSKISIFDKIEICTDAEPRGSASGHDLRTGSS